MTWKNANLAKVVYVDRTIKKISNEKQELFSFLKSP